MSLRIVMLSMCLLFKDAPIVGYVNNDLETSVKFKVLPKKDVTVLHEGQYSITVTSSYIHPNKDDRPIVLSQKITLRYKDSVIYDSLHKSELKKL